MWGQDDADKHMLTAEVWDGLAAVKLHQGILEGSGPTLQKAVALYQKALQCKQAKRGRAHPETAATVNNLAILFKRIGEYSQAELLFKEAAAVFRSHRASCEPFLANAEDELGGMLVALGRCEEAVPLLQDALQIRTRTFPTGHPARLTTQAQLQEALRRAAAGPVAGVASVGASSVSRSADASAPPRSRGKGAWPGMLIVVPSSVARMKAAGGESKLLYTGIPYNAPVAALCNGSAPRAEAKSSHKKISRESFMRLHLHSCHGCNALLIVLPHMAGAKADLVFKYGV
jgi:tetratricopeptide (TPR) repeat protein